MVNYITEDKAPATPLTEDQLWGTGPEQPVEITLDKLAEAAAMLDNAVAIPFPHGIDVGPRLWSGLLGAAGRGLDWQTGRVLKMGMWPGVPIHLRLDVDDMKLHPCSCKHYSEPVWMDSHIEHALTVECPVAACRANVGCPCQQHTSPHGLPFVVHRQRLERWQERHHRVMQLANLLNNAIEAEYIGLLAQAKELYRAFHVGEHRHTAFCCDYMNTSNGTLCDAHIQLCIDGAAGRRHFDCLAVLRFLVEFTEEVRYAIVGQPR